MSNRRKLPLILFGSVEDLSGWTVAGTPVITGSQTDPIGGTGAYLIEDNDGAAAEYIQSSDLSLTSNVDGEAVINVFLKEGTSGTNVLRLRDVTAGTNRHTVIVTWTGGVPALSTDAGGGTLFTPVAVGGGWYFIRFSATSIVTGNNHHLQLWPTGTAASETGTVYAYIRSAILFGDPIDSVRSWSDPQEGSEWAVSAGGVEDSWIQGTHEFLAGDVRWIPGVDVNSPHKQTGWDGRREAAWINAGWKSFLEFGWTKQTWTFVPDQTDADAGPKTCYLIEPMDDNEPDLEQADMTRTFRIQVRDSSDLPFEGY